uniref:Uncharacterized protein n=1 Tax=Oryza brachyantha TaxID=4533 RepID=J3LBJ5_ORYBR
MCFGDSYGLLTSWLLSASLIISGGEASFVRFILGHSFTAVYCFVHLPFGCLLHTVDAYILLMLSNVITWK